MTSLFVNYDKHVNLATSPSLLQQRNVARCSCSPSLRAAPSSLFTPRHSGLRLRSYNNNSITPFTVIELDVADSSRFYFIFFSYSKVPTIKLRFASPTGVLHLPLNRHRPQLTIRWCTKCHKIRLERYFAYRGLPNAQIIEYSRFSRPVCLDGVKKWRLAWAKNKPDTYELIRLLGWLLLWSEFKTALDFGGMYSPSDVLLVLFLSLLPIRGWKWKTNEVRRSENDSGIDSRVRNKRNVQVSRIFLQQQLLLIKLSTN